MQDRAATTSTASAAPGLALMLVALTPFSLGYFLSYLYRATNAVVAPDLVRDVGLTASQLGLLTAAYLLAFSAFQLPLGILLDRYGPRRVQAALVAVGGIGALIFGFGQSATALLIGRAIIGLGFSGGLMCAFKAVVIWVPEPRRPLANALIMAVGALGLIVATTPLEFAVQAVGWRQVFLGVAAFTFLVAALIFLIVPERQGTAPANRRLAEEIRALGSIAKDPVFRALAPLLGIATGAHVAIQTLWAGPWFRDVAGLDRAGVAYRLFLMAVAFLAGILFTGAMADRLTRRGVSLLHIMLAVFAVFLTVQLCIVLEVAKSQPWIWMLFGMTGQVGVLAFPWLGSYFGATLSARANSAVNLPMFGSAFLFQYAIGAVIDRFPVTAAGGYTPEAYGVAFSAVLLAETLALLWYLHNWRHLARADAVVRAAYQARTGR